MDYPQWLLPKYVRSARAAGATASEQEITAAGQRLLEMWASPTRHHHNLHHVCDVLSRVTTLAPETHNPDLVCLAAFYHGCVFSTAEKDTYTRNGGENEIESAAVAKDELSSLGLSTKSVDRVAELIIGLKKQPSEADPSATTTLNAIDIDKLALRDAHLGGLAAGPQKYAKYLETVQAEYEHIPEEDFLRARQKIIGKLLARKHLFLSPLGRQWEVPARENLMAELGRVEAKLAKIAPAIPAETEPPATWEHPVSGRIEDRASGSAPESASPSSARDSHGDTGANSGVGSDSSSEQDGALSPEEYKQKHPQAPHSLFEKLSDLEVEPSPEHDPLPRPLARGAIRRPDNLSSLEDLPDEADPGSAPRELTPAEKKKAERNEIARRMQERLIRRQQMCNAKKESGSDEVPELDIAPPRHEHRHPERSPRSASTPDWEEDDGSGRAGFEREPNY